MTATPMPNEKPTSQNSSLNGQDQELLKVNGGWLTPDRSIPVDPDDIEHAVARDQFGCAIVRAIQRRYPDAVRVRVNAELIGFSIGEQRYTYPTPPEAVEAIIKPLDTGGKPEPIVVRLRGGKVKDVEHNTDRTTLNRANVHNREIRSERKRSGRQDQMSTQYHEYNRFADGGL
jgi:hypothetical protein